MFEALYMGFETSYKTLPGSPTADKLPVINPQFKPAVTRFRSEALTGSPEPRSVVDGKVGVDFSFELEASKESITAPLKGLFGAPTSAGTTGFYDHYYTLGTLPSCFFEQRHTDISQNFAWEGCYIGEGQFNFEAEGLCKVNFSGMGALQLNEGASTVISGAVADKTGEEPINYLSGVLKLAGSTIAYAQNVSFRVNRGLDKRNHIDSTSYIGVIFGKIAEVSGTMKLSFTDKVVLDYALNSTEISLEVTEYSAGHGVRVVMPTLKLKPSAPITNDTGLNDLDFEFDAYARGTSSNIPGEAVSKYFGTGTIAGLDTLTLVISPDGGANQTVTFAATDDTVAEVVTAINAQTTLMTASAENGRIVIRSDALTGSSSSIDVKVASTADGTLGFDNVAHAGYSAKSILVRVSNASAAVQA